MKLIFSNTLKKVMKKEYDRNLNIIQQSLFAFSNITLGIKLLMNNELWNTLTHAVKKMQKQCIKLNKYYKIEYIKDNEMSIEFNDEDYDYFIDQFLPYITKEQFLKNTKRISHIIHKELEKIYDETENESKKGTGIASRISYHIFSKFDIFIYPV